MKCGPAVVGRTLTEMSQSLKEDTGDPEVCTYNGMKACSRNQCIELVCACAYVHVCAMCVCA